MNSSKICSKCDNVIYNQNHKLIKNQKPSKAILLCLNQQNNTLPTELSFLVPNYNETKFFYRAIRNVNQETELWLYDKEKNKHIQLLEKGEHRRKTHSFFSKNFSLLCPPKLTK